MIHRIVLSTRVAGAELANALSPVRLFNTRALGGMRARQALGSAMPNAFPRGSLMHRNAAFRMNEAARVVGSQGIIPTIKNYFAGHYIDQLVPTGINRPGRGASRNMYQAITRKNAAYRKGAAAALGAMTVGSMVFGANSLIPTLGSSVLTAGATMGATAGVMELGAMTGNPYVGGLVGGAFAAKSVYNLMRSGDQVGPF